MARKSKKRTRYLKEPMDGGHIIVPVLKPVTRTPANLDPQLKMQAYAKILSKPYKSIPRTWFNSSWPPDQNHVLLVSQFYLKQKTLKANE